MQKIGLTGSIAVGKSFVCSVLRELGCHILDADQTARDVVAPGTEALAEIVQKFGASTLTPDGELDRKKMSGIVFADHQKRELLNSIIHPRVIAAQDVWIRNEEIDDPNGVAVIDAALMIESGGYQRFDKLIIVWCEAAIQLERLMLRDQVDEATAKQRILAQMSQDEKKRYADLLIDTSGGFDDTRQQVVEVFCQLQASPS